jgi:hypothetical protein
MKYVTEYQINNNPGLFQSITNRLCSIEKRAEG